MRVQYLLMIATTVNKLACAIDMINAFSVNIKHIVSTNQTKGRLIAVPINVSAIDSLSAALSNLIMTKTSHLFIEHVLLLIVRLLAYI